MKKQPILLTLLLSSMIAQASESPKPLTEYPDTPIPPRRASRTKRMVKRPTGIIAGEDELLIITTGITNMNALQQKQATQPEKAVPNSAIVVKICFPPSKGPLSAAELERYKEREEEDRKEAEELGLTFDYNPSKKSSAALALAAQPKTQPAYHNTPDEDGI